MFVVQDVISRTAERVVLATFCCTPLLIQKSRARY